MRDGRRCAKRTNHEHGANDMGDVVDPVNEVIGIEHGMVHVEYAPAAAGREERAESWAEARRAAGGRAGGVLGSDIH